MILYTQSGEQFELCLSHVGMVIHSTTLDTEAKVKEYYGGNSWRKIEGRFLLGQSASYGINSVGGEATHTLTIDELPNLNGYFTLHGNSEGSPVHMTSGVFTGAPIMGKYRIGNIVNYAETHSMKMVIFDAGKDQPHNNMPPYKTVYIWERVS